MVVKRTGMTLALALALGTMLVLTGTSVADTFRVKMAGSFPNFRYQPDVRHIVKNDRIKFKNPNSQPSHTVTAYGGNWSYDRTLSSGERVFKKFRRAGTFKFRCRFHSQMVDGQCNGMCGKARVHRPG